MTFYQLRVAPCGGRKTMIAYRIAYHYDMGNYQLDAWWDFESAYPITAGMKVDAGSYEHVIVEAIYDLTGNRVLLRPDYSSRGKIAIDLAVWRTALQDAGWQTYEVEHSQTMET